MPTFPGIATSPSGIGRPRKSLGQHFLTDGRIANRIVAAAEPTDADTILEIGPGTGFLTRRLLERAGQVVAVELDAALAGELPARLGDPPHLNVRHGDARSVEIADLVGRETPYKLVANLPYYAAAPIVRRFLETDTPPSILVVMVQREVAAAMTAAPGKMTLMSVATQFYAAASVVTHVPPRCFRPPPKVSSAVVRLDLHPKPPTPVKDRESFFALVRAGFSAPRKTLRNSLAQGTAASPAVVEAISAGVGIDPMRRPATLSIAEWAALDAAWPDQVPRNRSL